MVRVFALIGFSYLIALVASVYFGARLAIVFSVVFLVLFLSSLTLKIFRKNKIVPIVLVSMSISFASYGLNYIYRVKPIDKLDQEVTNISGVICDIPYKSYNKYYYTIEADEIDFKVPNQKMKLRVSSNVSLDADVYDRVSAKVKLFSPKSSDGFTSKAYYASKNIHMFAYFNDYGSIKIEETDKKPFNYYILRFRENLMSKIKYLMGNEEEDIANGMLLGYKFDIDKGVKTKFRNAGISHLLAVSGYHVATVVGIMFVIFNLLKFPKKLSNILGILGVILFMAITGFSFSVIRAGIMYIIYLLGRLFSKKPDSLNSLGLAVAIICILNPFAAGDIGFLLSATATLGIITLSPIISSWFKNKMDKHNLNHKCFIFIFEIIAVTLSANIFTIPITMLAFKCLYPVSIISNVLIVSAFPIMFTCLIIAITFSYLGPLGIIAVPFSIIASVTIKYMVLCADFLQKLPFAYISTDYKFLLLWLAGSLIMIGIAINFRKNHSIIRISSVLSVIVLIIGIFSYQIINRNITRVAVLNVGNGISVVASKNGHAAVLSCGGDNFYSDSICDYLESQNLKSVDLLVASDNSKNTSGFVENIIENYPVYSAVVHNDVFDDNNELFEGMIETKRGLVKFSDSVMCDIWGNIEVSAINHNGESFVFFQINDVQFLLSPHGGDAYNLPAQWKHSAITIFSDTPDNCNMISTKCVIISMDTENMSKCLSNMPHDDLKAIDTLENDRILIDCIKDNEVDIHG